MTQNRIARLFAGLAGFAATAWVIAASIDFLRDEDGLTETFATFVGWFSDPWAESLLAAPTTPIVVKLFAAVVALVVGVGGVWALFISANLIIDIFSTVFAERLRPIVFVGPAVALLGLYLVYPLFSTTWTSFTEDIVTFEETVPDSLIGDPDALETLIATNDRTEFDRWIYDGENFEVAVVDIPGSGSHPDRSAWIVRNDETITTLGWANYAALGSEDMQIAIRNNVLWLVFGTGGSVLIGLAFAAMVDRVKREALAKTFVFLPLAISFVGASVIWGFIYDWRPAGQDQIGLLNAIWVWMGNDPVAWLQRVPINTFALIAIMIWLQVGFAMVILSAAIKGVPDEILEAARIDGASELQVFFRVIIPSIRGSILTVSTTIFIAVLKVFDIVFVMTGGRFDTEVIANRMFSEMFKFRNFGRAAAIAVVLFAAVMPMMIINVRNLRHQGIGS